MFCRRRILTNKDTRVSDTLFWRESYVLSGYQFNHSKHHSIWCINANLINYCNFAYQKFVHNMQSWLLIQVIIPKSVTLALFVKANTSELKWRHFVFECAYANDLDLPKPSVSANFFWRHPCLTWKHWSRYDWHMDQLL